MEAVPAEVTPWSSRRASAVGAASQPDRASSDHKAPTITPGAACSLSPPGAPGSSFRSTAPGPLSHFRSPPPPSGLFHLLPSMF